MSNLKLMIVDDEHLIRDLLRKRINWAELGMEIVCEASGAHEALDMAEEYLPDIIFTDICMPVMDGIEFSRIVINRHPNIRIVILTGHDEFEYAKRSIKVGISDFLLKPINAQEIKRVALGLKEKLEAEKRNSREYEKLKKQIEENRHYLREKFLNELIQKELDEVEIKEKLDFYNLTFNINHNYFQTVIIEVSASNLTESNGEEEKILLGMQCKELVLQYFRDDTQVYIFFENDKRVVILSNDAEMDIAEDCEAIKILAINQLKCYINIGIGNKVTGIGNIRHSYREACEALDYKIIVGKNQVVSYNELTFSAEEHCLPQSDGIGKLKFYLKAGLAEKTESLIDDIFKDFYNNQSHSVDRLRLVTFDAVSASLHILSELGIDISEIWSDKLQSYEYIFKADTLPEFKNYLRNLTLNIINRINSSNAKKVNKVITKVQDYIKNNLNNPELSLSSLAKESYLNQSHLSRLFKQETGQTFVEYITKLRMEKAIELIKNTDMKVYQIGEQVGIDDPHYLSIVFKKFTGLSINDFRKM